jgi:hypothetical protein
MSLRIAVVHEAKADFAIATELADRVLVESVDWLELDVDHEGSVLASRRDWISETSPGLHLTWAGIKKLAADAGIRVHGHFEGKPGSEDFAAARRAILFMKRQFSDLSAILLIRDQDSRRERKAGLTDAARSEEKLGIPIVVGLAIESRECWVLSGFDACDPHAAEETQRLEQVRKELGCDPRLRSQELKDGHENGRRSAKRVLRHLVGDDPRRERERRCWRDAPLDVLRQRGEMNGLSDYLREVKTHLVPLISRGD